MSQEQDDTISTSPLLFHVDRLTREHASGWAFSPTTDTHQTVEVWVGDQCVGRGLADKPRRDVGRAYPQFPLSGRSGFDIVLQTPDGLNEQTECNLTVVSKTPGVATHGFVMQMKRLISRASIASGEDAMTDTTSVAVPAPFPQPVMATLAKIWPASVADSTTDDGQIATAGRIALLAQEGHKFPLLMDYIRFLRATWAHFQFVACYFPTVNTFVKSGAKDRNAKPNSIEEMLSISHHLYLLKSHGVQGAFMEFGCFKGFSTALLSYPCSLLGIRMHVFDSFAGLPQSDSTYYSAGEFCGGYDEVRGNVEMFGAPSVVTYHKGYFSDTLPALTIPNIACLWMDVDLQSSARDVMMLADKLDERGAIFSHECEAKDFADNSISAGHDGVILPILERFGDIGAPLSGRFILGNTGAFWRRDKGIPVLSSEALLALTSAI
jgi:O-methyltransferase